MKVKLFLSLILLFIFVTPLLAQEDVQIGNPYGITNYRQQGGVYDYSDPKGVNIKVQLWGYVKYPGYYIVPAKISINELISYGGGPNEDAILSDIRVLKIQADSSFRMVKYNYNDIMWEDNLKTKIYSVRLQAGDVVVVPGEPRYFARQDISFYMSIVTGLASLAALIISIIK